MTDGWAKPRRIRNKNGCVCCRVRRKRCDGERPTCGCCERHGLICSWSTTRLKPNVIGGAHPKHSNQGASAGNNGGPSPCGQSNIEPGCQTPTKKTFETSLANTRVSGTPHAFIGTLSLRSIPPLKHTAGNLCDADTLFQYYIEHTAPKLIANSSGRDSFLSCVLPLAVNEPVLMSTLLAVSSSHITQRTHNLRDLEIATQCYASATSGLRKDLVAHSKNPAPSLNKLLYLLAATLILYQHESLAGRPGTVGHCHLLASRELVRLILRSYAAACSDINVGYLLDLYAYFAIVGNITPHNPSRIPADEAIEYLNDFQCQNNQCTTLACGAHLMELIPLLCQLQESKQPLSDAMYESVEQRITDWNVPEPPTGRRWTGNQVSAACVYQIALLISLRYVFYRRKETWTAFIEQTQALILDYFQAILKLLGTPATTTTMWSFLIVASLCKDHVVQTLICSAFKGAGFDFNIGDRAVRVLELTWSISTEERYGLEALDVAVKELDFCMG